MNNQKKQILAVMLGVTLCGGMVSAVLGMEKYEEFTEIGTSINPARELLGELFTKCWSELDKVFAHNQKTSRGGPFKRVLGAILMGRVTEQMKTDVLVYWGNLLNQHDQAFKNTNAFTVAKLVDECLYTLLNDILQDEASVIREILKRRSNK